MKQLVAHVDAQELEAPLDDFHPQRAAEIYQEHGAVIIRGLSRPYLEPIQCDIEEILAQSLALLPQATKTSKHQATWVTPDGTSFNEDPNHPGKMVVNSLKFNALVSGAFLQSLLNPRLLDVVEAMLGPDIELWKWGQCVYRQPDSGVPKSLHQDEYYFEHQHHTSMAVLSYAVDVDTVNSPLYVVPGSHKLGVLEHVDDQWAGFALDDPSWWDRAVPITGRAGDAILFHGLTIHGSPANRSDRPRPVFIQRYRRADDFCVIDVGNVAARRQAEQQPQTSKIADDWGLMVRGLRRYRSSVGVPASAG